MSRTKRGAIQKQPDAAPPSPVTAVATPRRRPLMIGAVLLVVALAAVGGFAMLQPKKPADGFAADRSGAAKPAPFDAKRAMGYLEELCKIGTRMSGTDGMKKQQEM